MTKKKHVYAEHFFPSFDIRGMYWWNEATVALLPSNHVHIPSSQALFNHTQFFLSFASASWRNHMFVYASSVRHDCANNDYSRKERKEKWEHNNSSMTLVRLFFVWLKLFVKRTKKKQTKLDEISNFYCNKKK